MIIFGLGNTGLRYRATRHNTGYMFLDLFAKSYKKRFRLRHHYRLAQVEIDTRYIFLIKPQCWMNQSGLAVSRILQDRGDEFLVVVDDVNLPLGKIRLRRRGSDGGHLGLRSIIDELDTANFWRLRIGIGQPLGDYARYVLRAFRRDEKKILNAVLRKAIKGVEILVRDNFVKAQNYINSVDVTDGYQANRGSG